MPPQIPLEDCYIPEPNSGCWLWIMSLNEKGYGRRWDGLRERKAHTVVYEVYRGRLGDGLELDHLCRVRCCVNPWHMDPVTRQENMRRAKPFMMRAVCKRGHKLEDPNLYYSKKGNRHCKRCALDRARAAA